MHDEKLVQFIKEHHLLSIASSYNNNPHCVTLFYAFSEKEMRFIVSSGVNTDHMIYLDKNPKCAGTIALETKEIGKIVGLQYKATIERATFKEKALYLKAYPLAVALNPTLWSLHVEHIKFIDNSLGFGSKREFNF